jgi:hypothetical protein
MNIEHTASNTTNSGGGDVPVPFPALNSKSVSHELFVDPRTTDQTLKKKKVINNRDSLDFGLDYPPDLYGRVEAELYERVEATIARNRAESVTESIARFRAELRAIAVDESSDEEAQLVCTPPNNGGDEPYLTDPVRRSRDIVPGTKKLPALLVCNVSRSCG